MSIFAQGVTDIDHKPNTRLYLLDIVRLIAIYSIIIHHVQAFITQKTVLPSNNLFFEWLNVPAQAFSFSGFIIVSLSSFLWGKKYLKWNLKQLSVLLLGATTLLIAFSPLNQLEVHIQWDIYHYLIICFISVLSIKNPKFLYFLGVLGLILLAIPFWSIPLFQKVPSYLGNALIGLCNNEYEGLWPLLPWIGVFWSSYALGVYSTINFKRFMHFEKVELFFWLPALLLSLPFLGEYYHVEYGSGLSCFLNRKPNHIFFSHYVWILFSIRLSMLNFINIKLYKSFIAKFISNLNWSKHFGVCYLLHIVVLSITKFFRMELLENPLFFNIFTIALFPVVEVICKDLLKLKLWWVSKKY